MTQKEESPAIHKVSVSYLYASNNGGSEQVPYIRLSGKWLKNAGFEIGNTCYVSVDNSRLVISKNVPALPLAENAPLHNSLLRENVATFAYEVNRFQKQIKPYTQEIKKLTANLDHMNRLLTDLKSKDSA